MKTWTEFFSGFENQNGEYIHRISQSYPCLTNMEFKLCCLLRAGYTNTQIAGMTNRTLRAVETARYRMRKKLPISTHEDLSVFLMRL